MSHTPHELAEEFPEHVEKMRALKASNAHFGKLADTYHEVNRAIHRAESQIEPMDDAAENALRRQRLTLKDEIYAMLQA
jgi:uncharacterized protein YdcH (DUF465 family)